MLNSKIQMNWYELINMAWSLTALEEYFKPFANWICSFSLMMFKSVNWFLKLGVTT